jgi:protein TonB
MRAYRSAQRFGSALWRGGPRTPIAWALAASLVLHAIFLSVHFGLPKALKSATNQTLDVILVNSKSRNKPQHAQALAQANLDGGGNTDENRRARTPLPPAPKTRQGNDLAEAQRRVAVLEQKQRQVLTQAARTPAVLSPAPHSEEQPTPAPAPPRGLDLASSALAIARLEAQISTNLDEYNKRPRKKFIGARTHEYRFAQYIEDWRQKIERVGNLNYPESARGQIYGSLVITVSIKSDGSLQSVEVNRPSSHKVLDDAARRIVRLAAPFAPFPPDISKDTDILEISRTWSFTKGDKMQSE